jgi:hypothetical protein
LQDVCEFVRQELPPGRSVRSVLAASEVDVSAVRKRASVQRVVQFAGGLAVVDPDLTEIPSEPTLEERPGRLRQRLSPSV